MSTPSTNFTDFWLYKKPNSPIKYDKNTGKWLLFYHYDEIDFIWNYLNELFDENLLKGVVSMKVSTAFERRSTHHVICLYTHKCNDREYTIKIGKNIIKQLKNHLPHVRGNYIYYKSDEMTLKGQKGHIYKVELRS